MSYASPITTIRTHIDACAIAAGDSARAFGGVLKPRPDRFVRLMRAGTITLSVAHRDVIVVVECWETSEYDADCFGDLVHDWLVDLHTPEGFVPQGPDGWLGGPYSQPDPDSGTPRSVMTVILRQGALP